MPEDLFEDIVELNRRAVNADNFEVAYHLLAAALHAAQTNEERIETVIALAREQGSAVDAQHGHPIGSERAQERGTTPLFRSLISTAEAKGAQVRAERVRAHHQAHEKQA